MECRTTCSFLTPPGFLEHISPWIKERCLYQELVPLRAEVVMKSHKVTAFMNVVSTFPGKLSTPSTCRTTARRGSSKNQETIPHQTLDVPVAALKLSRFQNSARYIVSHCVNGILLWQTKQAKAIDRILCITS